MKFFKIGLIFYLIILLNKEDFAVWEQCKGSFGEDVKDFAINSYGDLYVAIFGGGISFSKDDGESWNGIIDNVIKACKYHKSKLVFFDNVYSIGGDNVRHITENSPISPTSRKGRVRADISNKLISYFDKSELDVMIVRSLDFFSSVIQNSALMIMVYENLNKGKKAQWFCSGDFIHSIGYAPELAKGMAMLGNEKDTYNQIWNLPVDNEKMTGKQWAALFAELMGVENKFSATPAIIFKMIGWFMPMMSELHDMIYQYDRDYFFDSSKFNKRFNYRPISSRAAVKETLKILGSD